jgi:uncharacterized protein (DUF1330 family)
MYAETKEGETSVACYLIAHVDVTDRERYADYGTASIPQIEEVGGRILAVGRATTLEGEPLPNWNVIMEFPDEDALTRWYTSDAYRAVIPIRNEASSSSQIGVVKGWTRPA